MPLGWVLRVPRAFYSSFEKFASRYDITPLQPLPDNPADLDSREAEQDALDALGEKLEGIPTGSFDPTGLPLRPSGARELTATPWVVFIKLFPEEEPREAISTPIFCEADEGFTREAVDDALRQAEQEVADR